MVCKSSVCSFATLVPIGRGFAWEIQGQWDQDFTVWLLQHRSAAPPLLAKGSKSPHSSAHVAEGEGSQGRVCIMFYLKLLLLEISITPQYQLQDEEWFFTVCFFFCHLTQLLNLKNTVGWNYFEYCYTKLETTSIYEHFLLFSIGKQDNVMSVNLDSWKVCTVSVLFCCPSRHLGSLIKTMSNIA